jgi:hypothetical protein
MPCYYGRYSKHYREYTLQTCHCMMENNPDKLGATRRRIFFDKSVKTWLDLLDR